MPIAPIPELIADMAAGRMVILVDEEDRENEGDLVLAADHVTPEAINFMAKYGRGLICLTLTRDRCEQLRLPPMTTRNGTQHGTAFTVSIEAREGVTTGISAADRSHTIATAVAKDAQASDLVQPGHIFPLQARDGGVLMRAGHTEAGCDLSRLAGLSPTSVICEIMKDDGTMARLPDLVEFAKEHGLKIGTIADLIEYRSRTESIVESVGTRVMQTPEGAFDAHVFRDRMGEGVHLALSVGTEQGRFQANDDVLVRVHEPVSIMDWLDADSKAHSWPLTKALAQVRASGRGVVVLLNLGDDVERLTDRLLPPSTQAPTAQADLRTYGVGAQILKSLGVHRMRLLGNQRRMPSMVGFGLEVTGFLSADGQTWPAGQSPKE
jgi:3,4-dihydroxy 2-butanone 4-phosphate synthase / GTP cyclohydrolase II